MRVSDKAKQTHLLNNIQKSRSNLHTLQQQAATMKKVNKPSDDPVGSAKILENRSDLKNLNQYEKDINGAKFFLETTESTLGQLTETLVRAKELALQGASDTNSGSPREMIAEEVSEIYKSVIEMANRSAGDRYLFGGYKTTKAPFTKDGQFYGDRNEIKIQNHKDQFIPMNLSGEQVFLGKNMGYQGTIPLDLEIPKTVEELQAFKIKNIENEIQQLQQEQDRIAVRGPANIGRIERLDASENSDNYSAGNQENGVNIFSAVMELQTGLRTNDKTAIQNSLDAIDQAINQVNLSRAEVGGRVAQLNSTVENIQKQIVENKSQNSQIEDADAFETLSNLSQQDSTLKGILETSGKISQLSLLDFLR